jgi:hypothetical protein
MGDPAQMNVEALEKLIMSFHEQSLQIGEMQNIQVALTDACKLLTGKLNSATERLVVVENQLAALTNNMTTITNKQELLTMDASADHHLYHNREEIVADWRDEYEADFNSDTIPYADSEIKAGMDNAIAIRRKRNEMHALRNGFNH